MRALGPAVAGHGLGHHAGNHQDAGRAVLVADEPARLGTRMKSAMRCRPWSTSSSGVSFLAPRRRILVTPFAKTSEIELRPGVEAVAVRAVGRPALGQVVLVLGEDDVRVAQRALVGHRADARQRAADILLQQPQRAPDARAGGLLRIGAEAAEAGVEPDLRADRPIDDDDRERRCPKSPGAARCRSRDRGRRRPRRPAPAGTRAAHPPSRARSRRSRRW